MGTISANKLAGLSIIVGSILSIIFFTIRPGGGLVGGNVDPADAAASIAALLANSDMASLSFFFVPIGLILFFYGMRTLVENLQGSDGAPIARLGMVFFLLALIGWTTSSALALVIAGGNAGAAVGAVYVISLGINMTSSIFGALAFLLIALGLSTNSDFNKVFALVIAAISAIILVASIWAGKDLSMLQTTSMISGVGYIVTVVWVVTLGLGLLKKG